MNYKEFKKDIAKVLEKHGLFCKNDNISLAEEDRCTDSNVDNNYVRHDTFEKEIVLKVTGVYFKESKIIE